MRRSSSCVSGLCSGAHSLTGWSGTRMEGRPSNRHVYWPIYVYPAAQDNHRTVYLQSCIPPRRPTLQARSSKLILAGGRRSGRPIEYHLLSKQILAQPVFKTTKAAASLAAKHNHRSTTIYLFKGAYYYSRTHTFYLVSDGRVDYGHWCHLYPRRQ